MNSTSPYIELSKLVKSLSSEDYVWLIHLVNKDEIEYKCKITIRDLDSDLIEDDIKSLNNIHNINEVKDIVLNKYKNFNDKEINYFLRRIEEHKESISFRMYDFLKYKNDQRLLAFTLYKILNEENSSHVAIKDIHQKYLRFIYIIFVLKNSDRFFKNLERIEKEFSKILIKNSLHFKNCDNIEFYKWALNYIQNNRQLSRRFSLTEYSPTQDSEFKDAILSIFDQIYSTDLNAYQVLKDKIGNAWYQKNYRKKNKGRKHYYLFTDQTFECLQIIAKKKNTNEEHVLESLINEYFAKHCTNNNGKAIYSL